MPAVDDVLANNESYASSFDGEGLPAKPALRLAVLTCMDARIDVHKILGLEEGDAHVIRNAGGLLTKDASRSLLISQRVLGTEEIMVIRHTECGMLGLPEEELESQIEAEVGSALPFPLGGFTDLEADLLRSLDEIRADPFLSHTNAVRGFVYDVRTGRLREVTA